VFRLTVDDVFSIRGRGTVVLKAESADWYSSADGTDWKRDDPPS
jgi:hypothetical protein